MQNDEVNTHDTFNGIFILSRAVVGQFTFVCVVDKKGSVISLSFGLI